MNRDILNKAKETLHSIYSPHTVVVNQHFSQVNELWKEFNHHVKDEPWEDQVLLVEVLALIPHGMVSSFSEYLRSSLADDIPFDLAVEASANKLSRLTVGKPVIPRRVDYDYL